ncbi:hypothetical protein M1271_05130 [Patescibacteria group bacterium]|nr:hypothetical protein [Patescibacteria group bacterium]MCL5797914.1 hypothetical protein [Patescibacteria group bacterium]
MHKINIIHLGIGNVGKEFIKEIGEVSPSWKRKYGIFLNYCGMFGSKGGVFDAEGLSEKKIKNFPKTSSGVDVKEVLEAIADPFILIDTTASDKTLELFMLTFSHGGYVVTSNKKPFTQSQEQFDQLEKYFGKKIFFETTVGAALPVISTLNNFIDTGDSISEIKGCFSGTLGYIFFHLEEGMLFSQAVKQAKERGFTEPDPRDDLSGMDVARKALILARLLGKRIEIEDIKTESLYPQNMDGLTVDKFMETIRRFDNEYKKKICKVGARSRTLRYVASVTASSCTVGVEEVEKNGDLGNLKGPDNIIVFKTKRYDKNPLVVRGPGAGASVTAEGVLADVLEAAKFIYHS